MLYPYPERPDWPREREEDFRDEIPDGLDEPYPSNPSLWEQELPPPLL